MVMVMVMEILFHLGRPLAMRLLYKAPRTAQIQVTVGPVKEGGGEEKHTIIANRILMMIRVKMDMQSDTRTSLALIALCTVGSLAIAPCNACKV